MTAPATTTDMPGGSLLRLAVILGVLGLLGITALTLVTSGEVSLASGVGRPVAFALLGVLASRGRGWIRVLLGVWMLMLSVAAILYGVRLMGGDHAAAATMFLLLAVVYASAAFLFLGSRAVREFVSARAREARASDGATHPA